MVQNRNKEQEVFSTELGKFSTLQSQLTSLLGVHRTSLQELTTQFGRLKEMSESVKLLERQERRSQELIRDWSLGFSQWKDAREGLKKGITFYHDLLDLITTLSMNCIKFCEKRDRERLALTSRLEQDSAHRGQQVLRDQLQKLTLSAQTSPVTTFPLGLPIPLPLSQPLSLPFSHPHPHSQSLSYASHPLSQSHQQYHSSPPPSQQQLPHQIQPTYNYSSSPQNTLNLPYVAPNLPFTSGPLYPHPSSQFLPPSASIPYYNPSIPPSLYSNQQPISSNSSTPLPSQYTYGVPQQPPTPPKVSLPDYGVTYQTSSTPFVPPLPSSSSIYPPYYSGPPPPSTNPPWNGLPGNPISHPLPLGNFQYGPDGTGGFSSSPFIPNQPAPPHQNHQNQYPSNQSPNPPPGSGYQTYPPPPNQPSQTLLQRPSNSQNSLI